MIGLGESFCVPTKPICENLTSSSTSLASELSSSVKLLEHINQITKYPRADMKHNYYGHNAHEPPGEHNSSDLSCQIARVSRSYYVNKFVCINPNQGARLLNWLHGSDPASSVLSLTEGINYQKGCVID